MDKIIGIEVSRHASAMGVVQAVEKALTDVTDREVTFDNGESCDLIFVIQALPYFVGSNGNPWSPHYPTGAQAVALCEQHAPVEIRVV
jgi:hypothetical protein